jgi:hypothetical protein
LPQQFGWWFSDKYFNEFREDVEKHTRWRYSGGTDLILTEARFFSFSAYAEISYQNAIVIVLEELRQAEPGVTAGMLFERIFRAAESGSDAPVNGFSNAEAFRLGRSALWSLAFAALPESLRADAARARQFAVRDIGP